MYFGVDVGRGAVKVVSGPGEQLSFPSYLAPYRDRDLVSQQASFMDQLVVGINGQEYFAGELARREGGTREYAKDKVGHDNTIPLLVTGIALATRDDYLSPKVVVGLPVSDYKVQAKAFESGVLGDYRVRLPHKRVNLELARGQVVAFPEGAGVLWDLILGPTGRPVETDLMNQDVAVIDIGWKTCNVVVLRKMLYDDTRSTTFPLGLSRAFTWYYKRMSRMLDILPAAAELRMQQDGEPEYRRLAREIRDQVAQWWPDKGEFDRVFIAGGGGAALAPYLDLQARLITDAQLANARGFWKVARAQL